MAFELLSAISGAPAAYRPDAVNVIAREGMAPPLPHIVMGPRQSIAEIVAAAFPGLDPTLHGRVRVRIGGREVGAPLWRRVYPKIGTVLELTLAPGKDSLGQILGIIIVIAAIATGQFYGAAFGAALGLSAATGTALLTAGLGIAGQLLVRALIPLRTKSAKKEDATYSASGFNNVAAPNGVIPSVLGVERPTPPYAVRPFTEVVGDHTYLTAAFLIGYGPVEMPDELMRFGDSPISKFRHVQKEVRYGIEGEPPLSLITKTVIEKQFNVDVTKKEDPDDDDAPDILADPVKRYTEADITEWSIDIGLDMLIRYSKKGKRRRRDVDIRIRERLVTDLGDDEPWTVVDPSWNVSGKRSTPFKRSYHRVVPVRGRYEIELARLSGDDDDEKEHSTFRWVTLRSIRPEYPLNFPFPVALVAFRIRASKQLQGVIDDFSAEVRRVLPDWDHVTETWVPRVTRNPASIMRYVTRGPEYAYPSDEVIDEAQIIDFHDHCRLKNLTYDRVHDFEADTGEVIADICHAGRATWSDDGGRIGMVIERRRTQPTAYVTPRNSWGFEARFSYSKLPDAFRIKFRNRLNDFKEASREVKRPGFVGDPLVYEELEPPGLTDPEGVYRWGLLRYEELMRRFEAWTCNQDRIARTTRRGDLVFLSHDMLLATHVAGRVVGVDGMTVALDETVTMSAGSSYAVKFFRADGAFVTWRVATMEGARRAVVLTHEDPEDPGDLPAAGMAFAFGELGSEVLEAVLKGAESLEEGDRRLTLIPHAPEITEIADAAEVPPFSDRVGAPLPDDVSAPPKPFVIRIESSEDFDDPEDDEDDAAGGPRVYVVVRPGEGTTATARFEIRHRLASEAAWRAPPISVPAGSGGTFINDGYSIGDDIRVGARGLSAIGVPGEWTDDLPHVVGENDAIPPAVLSFTATVSGNVVSYAWTTDDPTARARIRIGAAGADYSALSPVHSGYLTASPYGPPTVVAPGSYRAGIVLEDEDGNESAPAYAAFVVTAKANAQAPEAFAFALSTDAKATYSARAKSKDAAIRSILFRRGPRVSSPDAAGVIDVDFSLATGGQTTPIITETTALPPGFWRGWAIGRNEDGSHGAAVQSPVDLRVPGQLGSDDFNRANGAIGGPWTYLGPAAGAQIVGNHVDFAGSTGAPTAVYVDVGSSEHFIRQAIGFTAAITSFPWAVRIVDQLNYIGLRYSSGALQLFMVTGGTPNVIASSPGMAVPAAGTVIDTMIRADHAVRILMGGGAVANLDWVASGAAGAMQTATRVGFVSRSTVAGAVENVAWGLV